MRARLGSAELEYQVRGEGPAVLFLHAFPLGLAMWEEQALALHPTHRVVRFDARGFGGTPPGDGLLSMERIADDAVALLDHLGLSRAVVVGLSMGGYAALAMVRRHPDRLSGLVLADTKAGADTDEGRRNRALLAERVLKEGSGAAAEAMVAKLLGATTQRERPAVVERVRSIILANPPRGLANALQGLAARADSGPTLREVRVPTLVACGEEDELTPMAEAETLHHGIAGSRLAAIPRAGHLANLENPAAFNQALQGFLAEVR
jgi:pimeloyl-ACP methyl ester carboxylesterase